MARTWGKTSGATVVLAGLLWSSAARAENQADVLFREARTEVKAGRYGQACSKFKESFRLDPVAGTMLNIGDCEEKQGKLAASYNAYARGLRLMPANDGRVEPAKVRLQALEPRVAWLKPILPAEGELYVDDVLQENLGGLVAIDPGDRAVRIRRKGADDVLLAVSVRAGETKPVELPKSDADKSSAALAAPATSPSAVTTTTSAPLFSNDAIHNDSVSPRKVGAFVSLGVGAAGLAVGTVAGLSALSAARDMKAGCKELANGNLTCTDDGKAAADRGGTMSTLSTVAFGVGIVGAGVGTVLLLTQKSDEPKRSAWSVMPLLGGNVGGASVGGRF